jgi:hypothetical protein
MGNRRRPLSLSLLAKHKMQGMNLSVPLSLSLLCSPAFNLFGPFLILYQLVHLACQIARCYTKSIMCIWVQLLICALLARDVAYYYMGADRLNSGIQPVLEPSLFE